MSLNFSLIKYNDDFVWFRSIHGIKKNTFEKALRWETSLAAVKYDNSDIVSVGANTHVDKHCQQI